MSAILTAGFGFLFCLGMIYGAIRDVLSYTIPNRVSYGLAALFIPFAILKLGVPLAMLHVGLAAAVLLICLVFWKLKWLGGGDVKFLSAVSLWMGPQGLLPFMVLLSGFSALFVIVLKQLRSRNHIVQASGWPGFIKNMVQKSQENAVPYGLPITLAGLAVVLAYLPEFGV